MNKLKGKALLPVYCQNTLVALKLIISKGFYLKKIKEFVFRISSFIK
jgi:hypothetical protein